MTAFTPHCCPLDDCPSKSGRPFLWHRKGFYPRHCDGRLVQRFRCLTCARTFSAQTFRLDYRLKLPELHLRLFPLFVSKVTLRQCARIVARSRRAVDHRFELLGRHCKRFHHEELARAKSRGGLTGVFQLDELETFEHSRKLKPVTVPILIERESRFVIDLHAGTLPARGRLTHKQAARKLEIEAREGRRVNESRRVVRACLRTLAGVRSKGGWIAFQTDRKGSYAGLIRELFGPQTRHQRTSSKVHKTTRHPLFSLHVVQAMMRDGMSRLVRRNWAHAKKRARIETHGWIWIAYRNWIRGYTNEVRDKSSAAVLGLSEGLMSVADLLRWRVALPVAIGTAKGTSIEWV